MVDLQTFTCEFSNCGIRCVDEDCSEAQTADVARRMAMIATALRATVRFTIIPFEVSVGLTRRKIGDRASEK